MLRCPTLLVVMLCAAACGGRTTPSTSVGPTRDTLATAARAPETPSSAVPVRDTVVPPLAAIPAKSGLDSTLDSLAEHRLAADSAADQAALEELAAARPSAPTADDADDAETETPGGGPKALTNTVTWDIDVASFSDHDRVQYYLDFFGSKGHERMGIWLNRMPRYEAMIRERLQKEGLPADLTYLALIESGFSNTATSRAKAVGMWQFMKGTARHYGLRIDSWVDERRDPYRATDAAARHLRDLTHRFGSVYLAAAAYNAGAGRVSRGLGRLPDDEDADPLESDATFFRLYDTKLLRRETKDYVPKLIAAAMIAKEPSRYGFTVTPDAPAAYDSIIVPDMTGLDVVARLADTTLAAIRELNPQYLRRATPPGTRAVVRLPVGRGTSTAAAYAELPPRQRVTVVEHRVRRGETLSGIAQRYGVSQADLKGANPKLARRGLLAGQVIVVPTGGGRPATVALAPAPARRSAASSARPSPSPRSNSGSASAWHRVRRGETLSEIADEYGVTVKELRSWNRLGASSRIRANQRLRVASAPSRAATPAKKRRA